MAFGKHGEGQLGTSAEGEGGGTGKGQEAEAWHLSPGLIPSLGDSCKVVWNGACSNQTFEGVLYLTTTSESVAYVLTRSPFVCSTACTVTYIVHVQVQR